MAITMKSRKQKGMRLQKDVADRIRKEFDLPDTDVKSVSASVTGPDLWLSTEAEEMFPFSVEIKNQEKLSIWKAIEQTNRNAKEGLCSLVIFSKNNEGVYAVINFDDLLYFVKSTYLLNKDGIK